MMWRNVERNKQKYLGILSKTTSLIVFDTETTGLGRDAKIIQFSAIKYHVNEHGMTPIDKMDLYINPQEPLSEKIIELTGITDYVLEKARDESKEAPYVFQFLEKSDSWAAYNCGFDLRMLKQMSERTGISYQERPCIDILEMARDIVSKEEIENHKLATVLQHFFPERSFRFHSALDDVKASALVMTKLISMYNDYSYDSSEKIQSRLNWASYWVNPKNSKQVRIRLCIEAGEYGDIFWDCVTNTWSCKSTAAAKRLFQSLDLKNMENQVLRRYGFRFKAEDMTSLAKAWGKEKRKSAG